MIVAFFGHSDFKERDICENDFISMLKGIINGENVDFYFGGYGAFDAFSYRCCCKLKKMNSTSINIELVYVTPYITESYQKNHLSQIKGGYDEIIYPEIEKVPLRFAISARNQWMSEQATVIFSYINHAWGGAYSACKYAISKGKKIVNMGRYIFKDLT